MTKEKPLFSPGKEEDSVEAFHLPEKPKVKTVQKIYHVIGKRSDAVFGLAASEYFKKKEDAERYAEKLRKQGIPQVEVIEMKGAIA